MRTPIDRAAVIRLIRREIRRRGADIQDRDDGNFETIANGRRFVWNLIGIQNLADRYLCLPSESQRRQLIDQLIRQVMDGEGGAGGVAKA